MGWRAEKPFQIENGPPSMLNICRPQKSLNQKCFKFPLLLLKCKKKKKKRTFETVEPFYKLLLNSFTFSQQVVLPASYKGAGCQPGINWGSLSVSGVSHRGAGLQKETTLYQVYSAGFHRSSHLWHPNPGPLQTGSSPIHFHWVSEWLTH